MLAKLVKSDFLIIYEKVNFSNVIKSIFNPSFHASLLIRIATNVKSKFIYILIRNILISKHSIDVGFSSEIGPGLKLPHPFGIVIGDKVKIGERLTIYQNCTLGDKKGYPTLGDDICIYCNSVIVGAISVGSHSIIGANSFLNKDISEGAVFYKK
jgi:serine O-acetyltransferase